MSDSPRPPLPSRMAPALSILSTCSQHTQYARSCVHVLGWAFQLPYTSGFWLQHLGWAGPRPADMRPLMAIFTRVHVHLSQKASGPPTCAQHGPAQAVGHVHVGIIVRQNVCCHMKPVWESMRSQHEVWHCQTGIVRLARKYAQWAAGMSRCPINVAAVPVSCTVPAACPLDHDGPGPVAISKNNMHMHAHGYFPLSTVFCPFQSTSGYSSAADLR